ncbi:TRANSPARENT TESTA protein 12 [Spatholobus suberectus]|nr:TRANSPARENT TESTA protein 12 [Spatholobus suberectus]
MEDSDHQTHPLITPQHQPPDSAVFTAESDDIAPIAGVGDFAREFFLESKKLWYLAGPAIFTSVCQYSLGAITQVFSGHVSTIALAAVSVENSVIAGFCLGVTVPQKINKINSF